jgi:hypothetical protein
MALAFNWTNPTIFPFLALPFFLLLVLLGGCASSGWLRLSRRFSNPSEPKGDLRSADTSLQYAYLRYWTRSVPTLSFIANEDALYLATRFPFSLVYPSLRIPWSEINISTSRRHFRDFVELTLGNRERVPLRISPWTAEKLGLQSKASMQLPREPNFESPSDGFVESIKKRFRFK